MDNTLPSPSDELRYGEHKLALMQKCAVVVAGLGTVLFPLYYFIDAYAHKERLRELSILRFSTTALFLIVFLVLRKKKEIKNPRLLIFTLLLLAGASVTGMCLLTGGYQSPVYAGVNLVLLTGALTYPVNARGMLGLVASIIALYYLAVCVQASFVIDNLATFINNSYFLSSTGIIATAAAYLAEEMRRESFFRLLQVEKGQADLKRQDEIKSRFFANVTHELRTPLTLILGPLRDLLQTDSLNDIQKKSILLAERNAKILLKHVTDLLDVARLEAGSNELSYSRENLSSELRGIASQFELLAHDRRITFEIDTPPSLEADVDLGKFERVIINLLSNAFKFTPADGKIFCRLEQGSESYIVRIADSGPGIKPDLRTRVFERFYQVEESNTRQFGGTGLGLSIVKDFVELLAGKVRVEDSPLGGAQFIVELPLKAPADAIVHAPLRREKVLGMVDLPTELANTPSRREKVENKSSFDQRPKILVVEDNFDMRTYILSVLSSKYQVITATNGLEGLSQLSHSPPDLILSDIMMPQVSGIDFLKQLRKLNQFSSVPLIFLTARSEAGLSSELLNEGAQDYITKPFSKDELLARVENWVSLKRSKDILRKELKSSNQSVESLAQEITESLQDTKLAQEKAEKALKLRDDLISLVSHELNTPLTSLQLQTQMTQKKLRQQLSDEQYKLFSKLLDNYDFQTQRLIRIVSDMLIVSKIEEDHLALQKSKVDLNVLVRNLVDASAHYLLENKAMVTVHGHIETMGEWDAMRLEQVMMNLLTNAVKYGAGKPITIILSERSGEAVIEVKDQGIGISAEDQKTIFDKFNRAVDPILYSGLGLGLTITKKIIEAHGGSIRVESQLKRGSTFTITLPITGTKN